MGAKMLLPSLGLRHNLFQQNYFPTHKTPVTGVKKLSQPEGRDSSIYIKV
jgi:hypothetical protein